MCGTEDSIKNPRFRQEKELSVKDGCKMTRHKTIVQNQFFMKRPWSGDHTQTDTQAIDKRCPISLDLGPKNGLVLSPQIVVLLLLPPFELHATTLDAKVTETLLSK